MTDPAPEISCGCRTSEQTGTANGYTCQWHRERLLAALAKREERTWERAIKRVQEEEEMGGPMPDSIWNNCITREGAEETLRATVRVTKEGIIKDFQIMAKGGER